MQYIGIGMKDGSNAVSAIGFESGKSSGYKVILDDGADFFVALAALNEVHGLDPAIVGGLEQFSCGFVSGGFSSHDKHFGAVSVIAVEVDGTIALNNSSEP
eukprot:CCRYP_015816-RA/>CCRYP_015816-RA protein AED:0.50 eAED:1.00 QI:0/-1/0/1/-1/1/1/0/100